MAERFYRRLASFARVVLVDRRGTGLSDPLGAAELGRDFEPRIAGAVKDFVTVLDAIGSRRAAVVASVYGADVAISFAAAHPDRVTALVLVDPIVRLLEGDDYPWGMSHEERGAVATAIGRGWGDGFSSRATVPSFQHDAQARRWLARYERAGRPRGQMSAWWRNWEFDVRPLLSLVDVPTLVMHHEGNAIAPAPAAADAVVAAISGAAGPVSIPGRDLELWGNQPRMVADEIEQFVVGATPEPTRISDRAFAVVLTTDLVASTAQVVNLGDRRWRELLEVHNNVSARQVEHNGGRVVKFMGDGVLAVFDRPAAAVHCAHAILRDVQQLGCRACAGVHAGEVELLDGDIAGIAVHIAARVLSIARPDEVLVSRTIKDLVTGSGLRFDDRGVYALKGLTDPWQVFAART
jgi:class 3 adenylate cyclase